MQQPTVVLRANASLAKTNRTEESLMNMRPNNDRRRAARRLLAGVVLAAAAMLAASAPASAAVTASFSPGAGTLTVFGDAARQHHHDQPQRGRHDPGQRRRGRASPAARRRSPTPR